MTKMTEAEHLAHMETAQYALENIPWALKGIRQENERLMLYVRRAKERGASWAEIGAVLGVSRQAAQRRFGHLSTHIDTQP
jgi:hypothetical protein